MEQHARNRSQSPVLREVRAVGIAVFFLVTGLLTLWIVKSAMDMRDSAVYIWILIVPALLFIILSGRLAELKGPGGWTARFIETTFAPVRPESEPVALTEAIEIRKESEEGLEQRLRGLDDTQPITLILELGGHPYSSDDIRNHIKNLNRFRNFKFAIFVDPQMRVRAYTPVRALERLLENTALANELVGAITQNRFSDIRQYPAIVETTLRTTDDNFTALQRMQELNLEALVVVHDDRRLAGLVEREQVLTTLILALSESVRP